MMKIKDLYEKIRDGIIVSDIDLQREIIYNTEKQALVIDSIMNNIPLPAFYLWENDNGRLEVLDGKQRIEAIKKFIQNDLQFDNKISIRSLKWAVSWRIPAWSYKLCRSRPGCHESSWRKQTRE